MLDPAWDEEIAALPGAHVLQSREWGEFKRRNGWEPLPMRWHDSSGKLCAAALVLQRSIRLGGFAARMSVLYVPRGPLLDWSNAELRARVLTDLQQLARRKGAIFLKIDPDLPLGWGVPGSTDAADHPAGVETAASLQQRGWLFSADQIQFRNSVVIDLRPAEEEWLARMKQKTRYNLRLAERKGVTVRAGSTADISLLYQMYAETSIRDGFVIRAEDYYRDLWGGFLQSGLARVLIAEVEGEPVGAVILFLFAGRAWYFFGMSRQAHREKMPNVLLQWEAMKLARAEGCSHYDLWGAPDVFDESDSMWGVFRFKEGLGGQVIRTLGAWDYPASPMLYRLYTQTLPRILDVMRRRGKAQTKQAAGL